VTLDNLKYTMILLKHNGDLVLGRIIHLDAEVRETHILVSAAIPIFAKNQASLISQKRFPE